MGVLFLKTKVNIMKKLFFIVFFITGILCASAEKKSVLQLLDAAINRADEVEVEKIITSEQCAEKDIRILLADCRNEQRTKFVIGALYTVLCAQGCYGLSQFASAFQKHKKAMPPLSAKVLKQIFFENNHPALKSILIRLGIGGAVTALGGAVSIYSWRKCIKLRRIESTLAQKLAQLKQS